LNKLGSGGIRKIKTNRPDWFLSCFRNNATGRSVDIPVRHAQSQLVTIQALFAHRRTVSPRSDG
jgi:hypothetical protein